MELSEIVIADQNRELYNKYSESVRACVCVKAMNIFFYYYQLTILQVNVRKIRKKRKYY